MSIEKLNFIFKTEEQIKNKMAGLSIEYPIYSLNKICDNLNIEHQQVKNGVLVLDENLIAHLELVFKMKCCDCNITYRTSIKQ